MKIKHWGGSSWVLMPFSARDRCIYCSICVLGVEDGGSQNQSSEETSGMMSLGKPNLVYISDSNWKCETMSCGSERDCMVPSTVKEQRKTYSFHPWGRGQSLRGLLYLAFSIVSVTLAVISNTSFQ